MRREPLLTGWGVIAVAAVAAVTVVALVLASLALRSGGKSSSSPAAADGGVATPTNACPATAHTDAYGSGSIEPAAIARLSDSYTFVRVKADGCGPVRFNPCQPVHYVQNVGAAAPFVANDVREAFRKLSEATGVEFVDDGLTDETWRTGAYVPERYGNRWAPILVVWEHFTREQTGEAQILGQTFPFTVGDVVVSARLRFNADAYRDESTRAPMKLGFGPPANGGTGAIGRSNITWGRIVLHELAHVAGLGHNRDPGSLMYPDAALQTGRPADFSRLDVAGLRYLGREAGCVPTPPLPNG